MQITVVIIIINAAIMTVGEHWSIYDGLSHKSRLNVGKKNIEEKKASGF